MLTATVDVKPLSQSDEAKDSKETKSSNDTSKDTENRGEIDADEKDVNLAMGVSFLHILLFFDQFILATSL